jgi:hypothetical protein
MIVYDFFAVEVVVLCLSFLCDAHTQFCPADVIPLNSVLYELVAST